MKKISIPRWVIIFTVFFVGTFICFFLHSNKMLDEQSKIQLFADSTTYESAFYESKNEKLLSVIKENINYAGPISILRLFNGNRFLIYLFNILIFLLSVNLIFKNFADEIKCSIFILLMCINPIVFSSMLSVNKEVISILAIACLLVGAKKMQKKYYFYALLASIFARWQLSAFIVAFFIFEVFFKKNKNLALILLIVIESLTYVKLSILHFNAIDSGKTEAETWDGSGLWGLFLKLQDAGLYFLIFPFKIVHSNFGILYYFSYFFNIPDGQFYNYVIIMLSSLFLLILSLYNFVQKKYFINKDLLYIALFYLIFFGVTPIYAPRYFFPVQILLALIASLKSVDKKCFSKK